MSNLRYYDGRPVLQPEEEKPQPIPQFQANRRIEEEIVARHENQYKSAELTHDDAVSHFDYAYGDLTSNPRLLQEVMHERQKLIERASRNGEPIDWTTSYREIGETVRKKAGLPSAFERERKEALEDMKGLKS